MDDRTLAARQLRSQTGFYRALGEHTPGGRVVEAPGGVVGAVVPARPERSVLNAVLYEDAAALLAARDELDAAYTAAGVLAWTVWGRPGDEVLDQGLAAAGHRLDGEPMLMVAALDEMDLEQRFELDLVPVADWVAGSQINDAAYGVPGDASFAAALGTFDDPGTRLYLARVDGEPACTVAARVSGGDCGIYFVATREAARGRGLASEVMRHALRAARAEGAQTTSLEATAKGLGVYERLGYRSLGRLHMWELRRQPPAS